MRVALEKTLESLTEAVIGAAFEVSNSLGHGFLESVYEKAMVRELGLRNVPVAGQVRFGVTFKGENVGDYVADLVVDGTVIVEVKAIDKLTNMNVAQVLNYLRASDLKVGLLLNFGSPRLEYRKVLA